MRILSVFLVVLSVAAQEPVLRIPPVRVPLEVGHQPIVVTASGTVSSSARPDHYSLSLSADLTELQGHITEILRTALDRSDDCGERISILGAKLLPEQPRAMLTADMHLERWVCGKALGKAIKKRVVAGNGTVRLALTPTLVNPTQTRLDAEVRDITADGSLGELLRSGSLGASVREKIRTSVQSALDKATDFRDTLPQALQDLVQLREVSFGDSGGERLRFRVQADAMIPAARLKQLREELGRHP